MLRRQDKQESLAASKWVSHGTKESKTPVQATRQAEDVVKWTIKFSPSWSGAGGGGGGGESGGIQAYIQVPI